MVSFFCKIDLQQDHRYKHFLQVLPSLHKIENCHNLTSLITRENVLHVPLLFLHYNIILALISY